MTACPRAAQERGERGSGSAMPGPRVAADERDAAEAVGRRARGIAAIKPQRAARHRPPGRSARRTRADAAPDVGRDGTADGRAVKSARSMLDPRAQHLLKTLDRALRRRRAAGRLARAVAAFGARAVAGDDPQRDGRSRGDGLHREPAHVGRARAHAAGLPLLRRQPDGREAARARRDPSARRRAQRRSAAAARQRRRVTAVAAHAVRRRRDDAEAARGDRSATSSSCGCPSGACC